jgi:hypothetical protein
LHRFKHIVSGVAVRMRDEAGHTPAGRPGLDRPRIAGVVTFHAFDPAVFTAAAK